MPDESFLKEVAAQLRKPTGEFGNEVASAMNESNQKMNLATIEALKVEAGNTILEVGMGNGYFISHLLSQADGLSYIGIDYSEDMVKLTSSINKAHMDDGKAAFHTADAKELPVLNHSVDRLFTINTIYFWDDQMAILKEFIRVLKPGGLLAISIRPERCLKEYPSTQFGFEYFTAQEVSQILEDQGFVNPQIHEDIESEIEIMEKKLVPEFSIITAHIKPT